LGKAVEFDGLTLERYDAVRQIEIFGSAGDKIVAWHLFKNASIG